MEAAPEVSVVIPVRDGVEVVAACLDGLERQVNAPPFEIVVVDNDSVDATAAVASSHPAGARLVRESRHGSYAARNAGLAVARGSILAFTDADCVPEPGWLARGTAAMTAGVDLVGGEVSPLRSAHPSRWERYDAALYLRQGELVARDGMAATANLFVRRTVAEEIGGFDPSLRSSGDLEFCLRAAAAGHRLVYEPAARVGHRPRTTLRSTWALHSRLGSGWRALARRGQRPPAWRDASMRIKLGTVVDAVAADGAPLRRRHLAPVHAVAMGARWWGWVRGGAG